MNYLIKEYPLDEYYFDFIFNPKNDKKYWWELVNKYGLYGIINLGYFNMNTYTLDNNTKYKGSWLCGPTYGDHGIGINKDGKLSLEFNKVRVSDGKVYANDDLYTYTSGCPITLLNGVDQKRANISTNGNTMIGFKDDGTPVILLCSKDEGQTSAEGTEILKNAGCVHVIRMDGSWSTQGRLAPGQICQPSQNRYDYYYLGIFKKNWNVAYRKKVLLDPFENASSINTPTVYKFMTKLQEILLDQQIECAFAKPDGGKTGGLEKASACNIWNADLCISCYNTSDSSINGKDARIITSGAGNTLPKNILANALIKAFKKKDYIADLNHKSYTILTKTSCPSNLILFNRNITDDGIIELAEIAADVIVCEYFGLNWIKKETPKPDPEPEIPTESDSIKPDHIEISADDYEAFKRVKSLGLIPDTIKVGDSINVPVSLLIRIIDNAVTALINEKYNS